MEHQMNPTKVALVMGTFLGGLHLLWSLLVAFGLAQAILNFIFWAHMVSLSTVVNVFDASAAATLIIATTICGYVVGYVFAIVWNKIHQS